jgi:NMD protein affecting ribosome stability and mRNA decay
VVGILLCKPYRWSTPEEPDAPVCPDCLRATASQRVVLRKTSFGGVCPECGGRRSGGRWFSAPVYPNSFQAYLVLMSSRPAPRREIAYPNPAADVWERLRAVLRTA